MKFKYNFKYGLGPRIFQGLLLSGVIIGGYYLKGKGFDKLDEIHSKLEKEVYETKISQELVAKSRKEDFEYNFL